MGGKNRFIRRIRELQLNNGLIRKMVSILAIILMVVTLLPTWAAEAGDRSYTIYFDSSNNPTDNGWSTTASMYVYGYDANGNSGIKAMQKSSRGNNLWEYTFDRMYTAAVFLPNSSWPSNNAGKSQDVTIDWNYASPCFKLDGGYVAGIGSKTGVLSDLGSLSQAGKSLKFVDMTGKIVTNSIVAIFGTDANFTGAKEVTISANGQFIVPNDEAGQVYKYVSFKQDNKKITETYEVTSSKTDGTAVNVSSGNIVFYYGTTEKQDDTKICYWGKELSQNAPLSEKKIYLDKISFPAKNKTYIKFGNGSEVELSVDSNDSTTFSYVIPSVLGATQQTIITIRTEDNNKYNFLWSDLGKNVVLISENKATVSDIYSKSYTIYFDATLSKLSYVGDAGDKGIPKANSETMYYYAWKSGGINTSGTMTKISTKSNGTNTWSDVYKADLNQEYDNILFYSGSLSATDCTKTVNLTIPKDIISPCFYADSSDDSIYKSSLRSGYWDEIYTVRNPEKEGNSKDSSKESEDSVVNLEKKEFIKVQNYKYISSTFYDFYTDYELNGKDRDSYQSDANITSHRIYQPFRQFDQALSSYYEHKSASSPIYWGNFQNYSGSMFTEIATTLNLYGYGSGDLYSKFFYENNSMWGRNGAEIKQSGENATLGLVNSKLNGSNSLLIKTSAGTTVEAPYFNEQFLSGNNTKNATLGKVYENVEFPFEKKTLTSKSDTTSTGTVEYWTFDSKTRSLEMKQAGSNGQYYLEDRSGVVKGRTTSGVTTNGNFFPFNTTAQSGNAATLNYGFGMKLEFDFRLSRDGTVTTTTGDEVPIEFNFSGDDDVWIFIDGELALDIGGGHGVVSGTLDFKNKKYTINRVKGATSGFENNKTGTFTMNGDNTSIHTLTMFYMERGLWESNMSISYNFPDENKISVEKQVDTTDVNDLFKDYFYDNAIFTFNIKNRVTHFGSQAVTEESADPIIFNDTFSSSKIAPSSANNTFKYVSQNEGKSDVVYWKAKYDDSGTYIKNRLGIIQPDTSTTLNVLTCNKFLQFSMYFSDNKNLSLDNMYIEVEDLSGNTISGWLSSKKLNGAISLKASQWQKIKIDLTKLESEEAYNTFDFKNVKYVKFGFKYEQGIYLDDITFKPEATAEVKVGFQTIQSAIPDYGSATSRNLENAVDALFSLKSLNSSSYYRVDSEGDFSLAHGDIATFTNQFRRGSYISITENVDLNVFSTKWTLFENGTPVSWYGSGATVKNPNPEPSLIEQASVAIDDGRIEKVDANSAEANYSGTKPDSNTIVFRSYKNPDDSVSDMNLKGLFVNKIRTGSLIIKKDKSDTSPNLKGTYTFSITFTNVSNMSLEDNPIIQTITLKYGEEYKIKGIPAGTSYYIQETNTDDGAKLETIEVDAGNDKYTINNENMSVSGVITADDGANQAIAKYTFKNTTRKKVSIELEKKWQDKNGVDIPYDDSSLPVSINVQLQRKLENEPDTAYDSIEINGQKYVEVTSGYEGWKHTFNGLDQYKDTEEIQKYVYRIVEVEVSDNGEITIPKNNRITLNGENYVIELGDPVSDNSQYIITNKKTAGSITIKKIDENNEALKGAKFKLERKNSDGQTWTEIAALDMTDLSEGKFENLEMGDYKITEIKAPNGYNILKDPIEVTLPYTYKTGDIVNGVVVDTSGITMDITFTVTNVKGSILPNMGGNGTLNYILVGFAIMTISFVMYLSYKKRNENLIK